MPRISDIRAARAIGCMRWLSGVVPALLLICCVCVGPARVTMRPAGGSVKGRGPRRAARLAIAQPPIY